MRSITAILLTIVFALSQYSRHLGYLECRYLKILKPATGYCDCEQLLLRAESPDPAPFSGTHHLHLLVDEFFERPGSDPIQTPLSKATLQSSTIVEYPLPGAPNPPWQPPETCCS